jgi:serine protease Do
MQPPDHFWAVLASRQDVDQAIAVAQTQREAHAVVTRASNGWFAVVSGPHAVRAGTGRAFLDALIKDHGAPKDTYLTRGGSFDGLGWREPKTGVRGSVVYDGEHDVTAVKGDLVLTLSRQRDDPDSFHPTLSATYKGKQAFAFGITDNSSEKPASRVDLVQLDPASPLPQVAFSYYWQGAHCCTVTRIASLAQDGSWRIVDGGALDGDGYAFEELGANFSYLVSVDNSFLYAFDSYAESYAPIRIQKLEGSALVDVTREEALKHRVLQDLYRMEQNATNGGGDTRAHGYLAGWVAASILAGRGDEAWKTMLASYNRKESMFDPETCSIQAPMAKCPDDKKVKLPYPAGLRQFLTEHGYMLDPNRYAAPE